MATLSEDTTIGGKTIVEIVQEQLQDAEEETFNSLAFAQQLI